MLVILYCSTPNKFLHCNKSMCFLIYLFFDFLNYISDCRINSKIVQLLFVQYICLIHMAYARRGSFQQHQSLLKKRKNYTKNVYKYLVNHIILPLFAKSIIIKFMAINKWPIGRGYLFLFIYKNSILSSNT